MIGIVLSNRYKLIAELGSGGMAWVYLAEDLRDHQKVAVKVLYPQHSQDLSFLQRFMQEARLAMSLSQVSSPTHIVRVLDYGSDRDTHYLVMEFVPGRDLRQVLEERGALPWQEALEIARQVALALDQAHQQGVVHRDIKPANIMLSTDPQTGEGSTVRVLDFGIARARSSPDITLSGFVGSPHYAAPEQAMGKAVDIRADLYSLGVVLYRMLSGNLPFQGDTPWAVVNQHLTALPPPLKRQRRGLPDPVVRLVEKAMAKRPEDRFQTPAEMVAAIEAVLAGQELPTPAPGPAGPGPSLEELYQQARQAVEAKAWQEAVDLFSQILKVDPDYRDVTEQLHQVGQQIRLAALYRAAQRAVEVGQWQEALLQLDKIAEIDPAYQDAVALRARVESAESGAPVEYPTQIGGVGAPPALAQVAAPPCQKQPTRWPWVAIPLLLLVVAVGVYLLLRTPQPPAMGAATTAAPTATGTPTLLPIATPLPGQAEEPTVTASPSPTINTPPRATATPTSTPPLTPTPTPTPTPTLTPTSTATPGVTATSAAGPEPRLTGQIAFPRFDPVRQTYDVYVCQVDGTGCRRVASEASQPDLLPNGRQLVLHSWRPDDKGLFLQSLAGQRIWKITGQIEAARPSVDSQGKAYVYHCREEADRQARLYRTVEAEIRPIQREGSGVLGLSPSWTPDGRILYSGCWRDSCGILLMRADGTFLRQVVAGSSETDPEASPDGQQVVFMSHRDGNWELYLVRLDGSGLRRLTHHPANDGLPAWSPDGRYLAFVSDRSGRWAVWVMDADGRGQRRLFDVGGPLEGQVRGAAPHELHGWVEERISWGPLP